MSVVISRNHSICVQRPSLSRLVRIYSEWLTPDMVTSSTHVLLGFRKGKGCGFLAGEGEIFPATAGPVIQAVFYWCRIHCQQGSSKSGSSWFGSQSSHQLTIRSSASTLDIRSSRGSDLNSCVTSLSLSTRWLVSAYLIAHLFPSKLFRDRKSKLGVAGCGFAGCGFEVQSHLASRISQSFLVLTDSPTSPTGNRHCGTSLPSLSGISI